MLNRLILIAEKKTVYQKFPTPLINRMEKHFVLISSVLEKWQEELLEEFERWILNYSSPRLELSHIVREFVLSKTVHS